MTGKFNKAFTDKTFTMKELPASEKPYEKCMQSGAGTLSDAELLAVILKTGARGKTSLALATELLKFHPSYEGLIGLHHLSMRDLMQIKGIGRVKAIQILCVLELSKRLSLARRKRQIVLDTPQTIARYYMERMRHESQELLFVALFDAKGHFMRDVLVSKGTTSYTVFSPREIFSPAVEGMACFVVILHNHPSGLPEPSEDDNLATKRPAGGFWTFRCSIILSSETMCISATRKRGCWISMLSSQEGQNGRRLRN